MEHSRFEPILLALLKRREITAEALVKAKEQVQELRTQLSPLKDEIQKLKLQRACLEEKLKLIHIQRTEDVEHYKVSGIGRVGVLNHKSSYTVYNIFHFHSKQFAVSRRAPESLKLS